MGISSAQLVTAAGSSNYGDRANYFGIEGQDQVAIKLSWGAFHQSIFQATYPIK